MAGSRNINTDSGLCGEVIFSQGQSADGVYGAKAYAIDCGAVGDFSLNIELTRKIAFGSHARLDVLNVMGRFTASFEWPKPRLLRVTVTCEVVGHCTDAEVEEVRKAIASSDRAWLDLKVDYALKMTPLSPSLTRASAVRRRARRLA